ncbi:M24 family metallopeptidase [Haloferacaceae archaeon DSL9]
MIDLTERAARLDARLDESNRRAIWFGRPNGFAWLTGGSNVVDRDSPVGVAAAGYVRDETADSDEAPGRGEFLVVTDAIEAARLADEEVPEPFEVIATDWYDSSLAAAVADRSPAPAAADFDVPGLDRVDCAALRQPLSAADIDAYRRLGRDAAEAVEAVCRELESTQTEREVAAAVRSALLARDIEAPVALVGGSERALRYRHYTPTETELGDYALVSVTAQRGGLYASTTRTVAFDPPSWLADRHEAAARVDASALEATRAAAADGGTAADVFSSVQKAYEAVGYPDEWTRHHQGGAAGFAGREWIATPTSSEPVRAPMAYAWNPTVRGAKSEDTVLVSDDGFETLTTTGSWPTIEVDSVAGGCSLQRHAPLRR